MPRQPAQHNIRPYNKLPSALRKTELIRLCDEFNLPSDGSVANLRDRVKGHLNQNRNDLFRNPRYTGLFPRLRRLRRRNRQSQSPTPPTSSHTLSTGNRSSSPTHSYASWNGFEGNPPIPVQPHQSPLSSRQVTPVPYLPNPEVDLPPLMDQIRDCRKFFLSYLSLLQKFPSLNGLDRPRRDTSRFGWIFLF